MCTPASICEKALTCSWREREKRGAGIQLGVIIQALAAVHHQGVKLAEAPLCGSHTRFIQTKEPRRYYCLFPTWSSADRVTLSAFHACIRDRLLLCHRIALVGVATDHNRDLSPFLFLVESFPTDVRA